MMMMNTLSVNATVTKCETVAGGLDGTDVGFLQRTYWGCKCSTSEWC